MVDKLEDDHLFKMILLGNSSVGKSSILLKFTRDQFKPQQQTTVGVQYASKVLFINDKRIKLQIWDTCGQQNYKALMRTYYKGASAALLVYDITSLESFKSLDYWYNQIRQYSKNQMVVMLVGNKTDLQQQRAITKQKGFQYAQSKKIAFYEISARDGTNVNLIFTKIAEQLQKLISESQNIKNQKPNINQQGQKQSEKPINQFPNQKKQNIVLGKVGKQTHHNQKNECCGKK